METPELNAEEKLQQLAKRLEQGWAKMHPTPEKALERVREAVREQWQERQANRAGQTSQHAMPDASIEERSISEKKTADKKQNQSHQQ